MSWISFLIGRLVPAACAGTIDSAGAGAPGVNDMWQTIRNVFVLNPDGGTLNAVVWFSTRITLFVASLSGGIAVAMVLYAGIKIIYGGEEGRTEAKKIVTYALVGVALMMLASVIIGFVIGELHLLLN